MSSLKQKVNHVVTPGETVGEVDKVCIEPRALRVTESGWNTFGSGFDSVPKHRIGNKSRRTTS